ncbi:MAG: hypothetical protein H0V29_07935 [Thermoleophilaceae bacterium]|nr:hypothetical protein [Thermoleophilaceae bacterium]
MVITPSDSGWKRGPLQVAFFAFDDFSGVRQITSSLDGGPGRTGSSLVIADEGVHSVQYTARDVAGNTSAPKTQVLRVDGGPPTTPSIVNPAAGAVTGDTTPAVIWDASTDSGSGVRLYSVVVRAGGAVIQNKLVAPTGAARERVDLDVLGAGGYSVQVFAADGTEPTPFLSASGETHFTVQGGPPTATLTSPAVASPGTTTATVSFDRPMNASTLPGAFTLSRTPGGNVPVTVTCNSPCTGATLTVDSPPLEGTYTASWSAAAQSDDGVPLTADSGNFKVEAYRRSDFTSGCGFTGDAPWICGADLRSVNPVGRPPLVADEREFTSPAITLRGGGQLTLSFTASHTETCAADQGRIEVDSGGGFTTVATIDNQSVSLPVPAGTGSGPAQIRLVHVLGSTTIDGCTNGTGAFTVDNLVLTR